MSVLMRACTLVVKILILPLQLSELLGLYRFYKRVFPVLTYYVSFSYNRKMEEKKRELFRELLRFSPRDGPLRLLEVGCGSGANFQHYPSGCKITCTDPNPHFKDYLQKSMDKNDHLMYENFVVAPGEDLRVVEDNSMDVVVCTLVLCSVKNTPRVIQEAKRVLRPGGAFFFLEHVEADPSTWTYFFQHVFKPLMFSFQPTRSTQDQPFKDGDHLIKHRYYVGDGCETTRATWKHIEAAGFSDLQLRHFQAPLFFLVRPHILGYAVK